MTATKTALDALFAAVSGAGDAALPAPERNATAEQAAAVIGAGDTRAWLNVIDGEQVSVEDLLGAGGPSYEIEHRAVLEWVVSDSDLADREGAFDSGVAALEAAIAADRTLGGSVDDARLGAPDVADGRGEGRPYKSAEIPVFLLFTSSAPY